MSPAELRIVLVRPRNPDNIGAAARAMANFGLRDLAVAEPFEPSWKEAGAAWRRDAEVSAVGALDIIGSAKVCPTLAEAVEGCAAVLGTSSLHRLEPERDVVALPGAAAWAAGRGGGPLAVVFGPEKTGLTKEHLSFCHAILTIPTHPTQPSMNLGQSVAVACYELTRGAMPAPKGREAREPEAAELARLADEICARLREKGGPNWGGPEQARAVRRGLLDARLTRSALHALKLLLK